MHNDGLDAQQVKRKGWRQGSVVGDDLVETLKASNELPTFDRTGKWVIVSHDCDVSNLSFEAEPFAEVIFAELIDKDEQDGNRWWGKSSRLLQIDNPTRGDDGTCFQFNVHDRHQIKRHFLAEDEPSSETLDPELISRLAAWIAKRYVRAAFPDTFVERTRAASAKFRQKAKKDGKLITGIYMLVPDEELEPDRDYEVVVFASMRDDSFNEPKQRAPAMQLLNDLEEMLSACAGIEVLESELRGESRISITELRLMKRWDLDDLTLRAEEQSALPAPSG